MRPIYNVAALVAFAAIDALAQEAIPRRIVVSIPDRLLAVIEQGEVVRQYPVAVGAPKTPSPAGSFSVVLRLPDPTWYGPGKIVPPGKANPLGTRWIGLSLKGYGIHGTNNSRSIGKNVSRGCIRMRNTDVEELFEMVSVGDVVEFRGERDAEVARIFGVTELASAGAPDKNPEVN